MKDVKNAFREILLMRPLHVLRDLHGSSFAVVVAIVRVRIANYISLRLTATSWLATNGTTAETDAGFEIAELGYVHAQAAQRMSDRCVGVANGS